MGFEPMPLSRMAPKATALTTRPNLQFMSKQSLIFLILQNNSLFKNIYKLYNNQFSNRKKNYEVKFDSESNNLNARLYISNVSLKHTYNFKKFRKEQK